MRRLILCFAAIVLVAAACGDDDASVPSSGESSTSSSAASSTSTASTSTSSTTVPATDIELTRSCRSPGGFTIGYPSDWEAVSSCGQFGPAPLDEPTPQSDERTGVVSAFVDPVAFEEVAASGGEVGSRVMTTVDGHRAARIETVTSGEGLYPAGTDAVRWIVDLAPGPDDEARTLVVDAYDLFDDVDFDRATSVLDAMASSVEVTAGEPDPADG